MEGRRSGLPSNIQTPWSKLVMTIPSQLSGYTLSVDAGLREAPTRASMSLALS